ncbi:uncharacterized protein LOC142354074 isoform X2 [Convolutriloba macropyga]|uniref:uncharacterized protein LOC142354074 isoform X2 n=1 Tax=Convolutriloba macropyga TaxID=536237 RepID=UPI003F528616
MANFYRSQYSISSRSGSRSGFSRHNYPSAPPSYSQYLASLSTPNSPQIQGQQHEQRQQQQQPQQQQQQQQQEQQQPQQPQQQQQQHQQEQQQQQQTINGNERTPANPITVIYNYGTIRHINTLGPTAIVTQSQPSENLQQDTRREIVGNNEWNPGQVQPGEFRTQPQYSTNNAYMTTSRHSTLYRAADWSENLFGCCGYDPAIAFLTALCPAKTQLDLSKMTSNDENYMVVLGLSILSLTCILPMVAIEVKKASP